MIYNSIFYIHGYIHKIIHLHTGLMDLDQQELDDKYIGIGYISSSK